MIMMGLGCISVSRRGETKETWAKLSTNGNVECEVTFHPSIPSSMKWLYL